MREKMHEREKGPFFIVFEGIDGAGKGTQAQLLTKALIEGGYVKRSEITYTREPSETPLGNILRNELRVQDTDSQILALLFAADRAKHVQSKIIPSLSKNGIVICERYVYSSFAYQGEDVDSQWIADINFLALVPDIVFYLDVPTNLAQERIKNRNGYDPFNDTSNKTEFFEKKWLFLNTVNERFRDMCDGKINIQCSSRYKKAIEFSDTTMFKINAQLTPKETHEKVMEITLQLLNGELKRIANRYNYSFLKSDQKTLYHFFTFKPTEGKSQGKIINERKLATFC